MASTASAADPEHNTKDREEDENAPAADDEDTGAQVAPIVKLEEVALTTGEEDEDPILDLKAKLYRFDKEGNQWKERGVGNVKLLKHKESGKVRLVMRQSKTLKICANHLGKKRRSKEAADAAGLLEKLSVVDGKTDEKEKEEGPVEAKEQHNEAEGEKAKADAKKEDEIALSA
ncbi:hypothetical protein GH714_017783 [Hevea brasiliensis]|uniref:RanBD1 domain-containing protein n=1 Tax=Hevea brasiliensis TaxID=3981 RepID=A0A6A6M222_HEVBR|nr:hypothetical protein GH714_017783 [Hevea brasiliensis]